MPIKIRTRKIVWLHREAEENLAAYLAEARIEGATVPMFQTLDKAHKLSGEAISRRDMLRVVKQRSSAARLSEVFCNHTFRGTGIMVFLHNGGALEAVDVAEDLFRKGLPLIPTLNRRLALDIDLFSRGGMKILEKIRDQNYNVLRRRPKISKAERAILLIQCIPRLLQS